MRAEMEKRSVKATLAHVEVRSDADGKPVGFTGYAAVFNSPTMIGEKPWGFREQVAPGAFAKAIAEGDPVMLVNHNDDMPLARKSAGTLRLTEDERGLKVDADLPNTTYGRDLAENLRNGNVKGMSFRFGVVKDEWETGDDGVESRTLKEVKLPEVSAVTFPAYPTTSAGLRSIVSLARKNRRSADSDDDPASLAAGLDASIDALADAAAEINSDDPAVLQVLDMIKGLDPQSDALLEALGVPDPDDMESPRSHEPAKTTRVTDQNQPARSTGNEVETLRLRMRGLAAIHGFTP